MTGPVVAEGHLHPITSWRRAWTVITGVGLFAFRDLDRWIGAAHSWPRWLLILIVATVSLLASAYGYMSWRLTVYRLTDDALHVRTGIVFQRRQRFELAHLQAAEIRRPVIGRWIGVCTLRLSVSGKSTDLSYLGEAEAAALHKKLLEPMADDSPASRPEVMLSIPARVLALSIILDAHTMIRAGMVMAGGLLPYLVFHEPLALLSLPGALGTGWRMTASRWPRWHGWTLVSQPGGYRADYGMFNRQHQTLRHQRTQAVVLVQPILWRRRDWVQIKLATAGYRRPVLVAPVASREQAEGLIADLYGPDAVAVMQSRKPAPRRARWATVWSRNLSFNVSPDYACEWRGLFLRNVVRLSPTTKVQDVETVQGPWQRRLNLATVRLSLAGGPALEASHRDASEAARLVAFLRAHNRPTIRNVPECGQHAIPQGAGQ